MSILKKLFDLTTDWIWNARSCESREVALDEYSQISSALHLAIGENISDVDTEQFAEPCAPIYPADLDQRTFQELLKEATEYQPHKSLIPQTLRPPNAQELSMGANLIIRALGDNKKGKGTR
jgi:hypothetical protein